MHGSHCGLLPSLEKSVASGSGVWLCTRNPLISAAISEKSIYVNICISVHAITIIKVCFHGQRFQFWCLKVCICIIIIMKDAPHEAVNFGQRFFFVHHTSSSFSSLSLQASSDSDSSSSEDVASARFASASDVGSLVRDSETGTNLVLIFHP